MAITDWPEMDRPREKLLAQGPQALTDAELLAIFLRTGVKGASAVDLARQLIHNFDGLRNLLSADQRTFCQHHGLGQASFVQLKAVMEMARRHLGETLKRDSVLTSPEATRNYLLSGMRDLDQEEFHMLLLDNQHRLITDQMLFRGTLNAASVYPREVIKSALAHQAAAVILAHNHPSGVAEPSRADELITQRLKQGLELVDIRLLDHLVVGDGEVVSMAERGML